MSTTLKRIHIQSKPNRDEQYEFTVVYETKHFWWTKASARFPKENFYVVWETSVKGG